MISSGGGGQNYILSFFEKFHDPLMNKKPLCSRVRCAEHTAIQSVQNITFVTKKLNINKIKTKIVICDTRS